MLCTTFSVKTLQELHFLFAQDATHFCSVMGGHSYDLHRPFLANLALLLTFIQVKFTAKLPEFDDYLQFKEEHMEFHSLKFPCAASLAPFITPSKHARTYPPMPAPTHVPTSPVVMTAPSPASVVDCGFKVLTTQLIPTWWIPMANPNSGMQGGIQVLGAGQTEAQTPGIPGVTNPQKGLTLLITV